MQKLAPGSRWVNDTAVNTDGTEVSIDDTRVMFCDKCGESTVDVTDTLAVIDSANLDPVRIGIREFLDTLHANDDTKHFDKSTLDALEKLEAVL